MTSSSPSTDCAPTDTGGGFSAADAEAAARLLKAVADPVRLRLISVVRATEGREACVCDLTAAVGLSQPTVSHHLRILVEAGIMEREQRGRWAWFSLVPARLDEAAALLTSP